MLRAGAKRTASARSEGSKGGPGVASATHLADDCSGWPRFAETTYRHGNLRPIGTLADNEPISSLRVRDAPAHRHERKHAAERRSPRHRIVLPVLECFFGRPREPASDACHTCRTSFIRSAVARIAALAGCLPASAWRRFQRGRREYSGAATRSAWRNRHRVDLECDRYAERGFSRVVRCARVGFRGRAHRGDAARYDARGRRRAGTELGGRRHGRAGAGGAGRPRIRSWPCARRAAARLRRAARLRHLAAAPGEHRHAKPAGLLAA